jgi:uncharacterized YccA/Bax inhibitor family protein
MQSNNPVLGRSDAFKSGGYATFGSGGPSMTKTASQPTLEDLYAAPSASPSQTGRMTYDDVVVRTGMMFAVVLAGAAVGWLTQSTLLMVVGAIGGLVLGIVNAVKREPSPPLILAYAGLQGLFLGGVSSLFEGMYPGIAIQALLATFTTFGVMLALYRSGKIRVTARFQKIMLGAIMGYALFALVNLVLSMTGIINLRGGGFGLLIGAVGAVLAALSLALDFDMIENGVRNGIPQRYAWTAAFGLVVTLIWLYIEFLRIIAILRGDD